MVSKHMIEDREGECVREVEMILKCVLGVVARLSRAGKVVCLYTRWSSHEEAEHDG